jgi:hypothetical protein
MLEADTDAPLIRQHTQVGRPMGDAAFLAWIEAQSGQPVPGGPRGRPKR